MDLIVGFMHYNRRFEWSTLLFTLLQQYFCLVYDLFDSNNYSI